jgi:dTDP-4-dehydrorhamnose 3,5-epimerase
VKILEVVKLPLPGALVVRFSRFKDHRGYFTEIYQKNDFQAIGELAGELNFLQANEGYSLPFAMRGLHYQWNPAMGKLVRVLFGRLVDIMLDLRLGSPAFGAVILYELKNDPESDFDEWLWLPPGLAHGNYFTETTKIEYFCSAQYNPPGEGAVSLFAPDLNWSLCQPELKSEFESLKNRRAELLVSEKDQKAPDLAVWQKGPDCGRFKFRG